MNTEYRTAFDSFQLGRISLTDLYEIARSVGVDLKQISMDISRSINRIDDQLSSIETKRRIKTKCSYSYKEDYR